MHFIDFTLKTAHNVLTLKKMISTIHTLSFLTLQASPMKTKLKHHPEHYGLTNRKISL